MAEEVYDLISAMQAGDVLTEAERRYEIIAEMMDPRRELGENERPITGTEIKALSIEADRLMQKIVKLREEKKAAEEAAPVSPASADQDMDAAKLGKVVAFDAGRYRKSG